MWIVPGPPLADGAGWRVWYSREGNEDFTPSPPEISCAGQPVSFTSTWNALPAQLPLHDKNNRSVQASMNRRMGVLTLMLDEPRPGTLYDITISEAARSLPFQWSTMPDRVTDDGVTFLFGSCFSHKDDKAGKFAAALKFLTKSQDASRPAFKLMIGDQVYQDWPPVLFTRRNPLQIYADRYEQFWGDDAYRGALQACPNFFLCDDHEFWNDYPEYQTQLPITHTPEKRKVFGEVAHTLYRYYQQCLNPEPTPWTQFEIDPVSFFIADSRSERDEVAKPGGARFFSPDQWKALKKWAKELNGPGVFVIGQPPFQKDGDKKDHSLSNFPADYLELWKVLAGAQGGYGRTPHNILVLSGDIHTGRFATGTIIGRDPGHNRFDTIHEFIASPASVLTPDSLGKKDEPPDKMPAENPVVKIATVADDLTTANNIGLVRMSPGNNGCTQFDLTLWRVSPYSGLNYFKRGWDAVFHRQGDIVPVFSHTIQLQ